ncbi:PIG-L deacetylase family protein [Pseudomonas sp. H11T01]|uniref:PIG-L deacetylase family protein n=1 Tax=Pseudomonas sp. H11T01 TaxID=3402749 RepID=UPI003AC35720
MRHAPQEFDNDPIRGQGTSLKQWQISRALQRIPTIPKESLLPLVRRLVIVAPHPDDEILMCGGLLASLADSNIDLVMISVTDGEGSHPGSSLWPPDRLRALRPQESYEALARLGINGQTVDWFRLGLTDSLVPRSEQHLAQQLCELLHAGDQVITTWRHDGHCDHEAVGRACANATRICHAHLREAPVWTWHWANPEDRRVPWSRARKIALSPKNLTSKRKAIQVHKSQLVADPSTGAAPILSSAALDRLMQPFELFFV